jgi:hypothetical protein
MKYQGSCHCGKVQYEIEADIQQVLECNCSHCSRKGYLLLFIPRTNLQITGGEQALKTYTFNKHVIKHQFCTDCGCSPFAYGIDKNGMATAAINARCLDGLELSELKRIPVDGRSF